MRRDKNGGLERTFQKLESLSGNDQAKSSQKAGEEPPVWMRNREHLPFSFYLETELSAEAKRRPLRTSLKRKASIGGVSPPARQSIMRALKGLCRAVLQAKLEKLGGGVKAKVLCLALAALARRR